MVGLSPDEDVDLLCVVAKIDAFSSQSLSLEHLELIKKERVSRG